MRLFLFMFSSLAFPAFVAHAEAMRHVVLVHGIYDSGVGLRSMAQYLTAKGCTVHSFTYRPNDGSMGLDVVAGQLAAFVKQELPPAGKFDLVAFSMGGLVARSYIQDAGGAKRLRNFVSISAPNHGTLLAHLLWNPAGRQMRPDSGFLNHLNSDVACYGGIPCLTLRTPFDLAIIPSVTTEMTFAKNVEVHIPLHPLMVLSGRVNDTVFDFLIQAKPGKIQ